MAKKISAYSALIATGLASLMVATPAAAYDGYNGKNYNRYQQYYYDDRGNAYPVNYDDDRDYDRRDRRDRRDRDRYRDRRCKSGTTGTILGGVIGGLLGREIGRGGRYNRPSTTGTIIGAGAGALAGRALEKSGSRC